MKNDLKLQILFALFIGLLVGMNLLGGKITTLLGVPVSVAIFIVPFTFLITDIVEEVHGRKLVQNFIISGLIVLAVMFLYILLFINLDNHPRYTFNSEYVIIFGSSLRLVIASMVAFFLAQMHDVLIFEWLKKKTKKKALWLRNNISTMLSQLIDTFVFMMIAFYGITPKFTFAFIISLVIPYYLFKIAFAALDTPLVYLGVRWLRK